MKAKAMKKVTKTKAMKAMKSTKAKAMKKVTKAKAMKSTKAKAVKKVTKAKVTKAKGMKGEGEEHEVQSSVVGDMALAMQGAPTQQGPGHITQKFNEGRGKLGRGWLLQSITINKTTPKDVVLQWVVSA